MDKIISLKPKNKPKISDPLPLGILLFFFSSILLGLQSGNFDPFGLGWEFSFPVWLYRALGIVALAMSVCLMIAVLWKRLWREKSFSGMPPWGEYPYRTVFWLIYTVSWITALSTIPPEEFFFHVSFWGGFAWFLVIGAVFSFIPAVITLKTLVVKLVRREPRG